MNCAKFMTFFGPDLHRKASANLAVTAFAELRLLQLLADPGRHDPLRASSLEPVALAALADANDRAAAADSLDATLQDWRRGETIGARAWLRRALDELMPLAQQHQLVDVIHPLHAILEQGNQAMRWLQRHQQGEPIAAIVASDAAVLAQREQGLG
jgi:predicted glutamate--cysteine ligase